MIGKLKGLVDSIGDDCAIIDVQGVGYLVHCSQRTLQALPRPGEAVSLAIETFVREDQLKLFGFASAAEREWFNLLREVQGVGAKVALSILSSLKPGELASAIGMQDKAMVARAPGVGPKLAQRIVLELKGKAPAAFGIDAGAAKLSGELAEGAAPKVAADAVSALTNLGYGALEANTAVAAALKALGEKAEVAALIRQGLKELAR